jgi:hypothetical protein
MRDGDPPPDPQADLQDLARDWITLWQSELSALAVDREAQEGWQALLAVWAGAAAAMLQGLPRGGHDSGRSRAPAAPRAAPAAAAPDAGDAKHGRDAEIERLGRRIAELERRLAELERGGSGADAGDRRRTGRARGKVSRRNPAGGNAAGS